MSESVRTSFQQLQKSSLQNAAPAFIVGFGQWPVNGVAGMSG